MRHLQLTIGLGSMIALTLPSSGGSISGSLTYNGPEPGDTLPGNKALSFEGSGDFVVIPSLTDLSGDEISIAYWFKGSFHRSVVRQQSSGYNVAGYSSVHILSNDGGTTGIPADGSGGALVQDGKWHHVVMTWKRGTTNGFASYLDGMPVASRDSAALPIPNLNAPTYFGSVNGVAEFTNGCIDEVTIWNRVLTPGEIAGGWNQRLDGDEEGLIGYWTFDDGTASDSTGNGHAGELSGAVIMPETIPALDGIPLMATAESAGPYLLEGAPDGVGYFIDAYFDRNGNGVRDPDEWRAGYSNDPLTISGETTGIDLVLYNPDSVWLTIARSPNGYTLRWPEFAVGASPAYSEELQSSSWEKVNGEVMSAEGVRSVEVVLPGPTGYFRLESNR